MKHRYRFLLISLVILILFVIGQASIDRSGSKQTSQHNNESSLSGKLAHIQNITGTLLLWPHSSHRNKRSQTLNKNGEFLYGRIYDIRYRSAINWLNNFWKHRELVLILENEKYEQHSNDFALISGQLTSPLITLLHDAKLLITLNNAKTFLVDKRRAIQTANLNRTSFVDNRESFFLSDNPYIRADLMKLFLLDSKKIADPGSVSSSDYQEFIDESTANLLVCPLNCRQVLEYLLRQAQDRIWVSAQYVIDPNIIKILHQQQDKDIRIRTNQSDSNRNLIRAIGQDRIIFEDRIYNHDKLLVIDDMLILGSMNLSDNALDNNREIGIILTDPSYITQVTTLFQHQKFLK